MKRAVAGAGCRGEGRGGRVVLAFGHRFWLSRALSFALPLPHALIYSALGIAVRGLSPTAVPKSGSHACLPSKYIYIYVFILLPGCKLAAAV